MAYGGVITLKQTILHLLDSSRFSLDSPTRENLGSAYEKAASLHEVLKRLDDRGGGGGKRLDSLDGQIREAVHKLEDFLELLQYSDVILDSEQVMRQEISRFAETAKKLREDYAAELDNPSPEEEEEEDGDGNDNDDDDDDDSAVDDGVEMVGYSDEIRYMKSQEAKPVRPDDWGIMSIFGLKGSGRSYLARRVFEDVGKERGESFDVGVWVTVGANYRREDILLRILTQVLKILDGGGGGNGAPTWFQGDEETARGCLHSKLVGRRYVLVLDDVWDTQILDYLFPLLPKESNGSLVLMTTSLVDVAKHPNPFGVYKMHDDLLNFEDIFCEVFRLVLFRRGVFPAELEEAGWKIIRNCRGLKIVMSKVLLFLWSAGRTPAVWSQIADDEHHPLYHVADDELSEISRFKDHLADLAFESDGDKNNLYNFVEDNGITLDIESAKKLLFPERFFPKMEVISFVGMAGIGKTTFVKKIFEYVRHFDHYVWITLGPKYQSENTLVDILAQINLEIKGDDHDFLIRELSNKRFFLVLDDVWDEAPLQYLANLFPNIKGRAMVTTRMAKVAHSEKINFVRKMRLLNKEESWDLLRQKVFGMGSCPSKLEKVGKKIAENCDGLPLTVLKVANLLSKDLSPQYWNDVAKKNADFTNALRRLSNKLLPSYKCLPHYLKLCFLYMGAFPENDEISTSKVVKLWIAEGILEPDLSQRIEDYATQCLSELVDRNLLMVCQKGTSNYGVKVTRLNSILWHLSNSEAEKINFFHVFNGTSHAYNPSQGIKKQRRFCMHNCILFSFKHIHDSMRDSVSTARSLLCSGPYQQYPPPTSVCFEFRLLRVLDTLAIRFYEFPIEVVELIQLRYLAITCNGKIPASIHKLLNLQFLIVSQHLRIKSFGDCWYLPMEIWDMKELRHLQVSGSILPTPTCGTILPNLETLLDVIPQSCSEEVLRGIPNLNKLGIQIELAPDDDDDGGAHYIHYIIRLSNLSKLESLKCVVLNPEVVFEDVGGLVSPPALMSVFSRNLEKLSLSGLGYTWEYMNTIIHKLENLRVLKLRCYAFKGPTWQMCDYCSFDKLEYILIEDTDLVCWKTTTTHSFGNLRHLSIKHCYNLEQLPYTLMKTQTIEVVDCNPYAMDWAKRMQARKGISGPMEVGLKIHVESSWDVGQPRFQRNLKKG